MQSLFQAGSSANLKQVPCTGNKSLLRQRIGLNLVRCCLFSLLISTSQCPTLKQGHRIGAALLILKLKLCYAAQGKPRLMSTLSPGSRAKVILLTPFSQSFFPSDTK